MQVVVFDNAEKDGFNEDQVYAYLIEPGPKTSLLEFITKELHRTKTKNVIPLEMTDEMLNFMVNTVRHYHDEESRDYFFIMFCDYHWLTYKEFIQVYRMFTYIPKENVDHIVADITFLKMWLFLHTSGKKVRVLAPYFFLVVVTIYILSSIWNLFK